MPRIDTQTLAGQADLRALKNEILTDPSGLGLNSDENHDAANAAKLDNEPVAPGTTRQIRVQSIATTDLWEACDQFERQALTDRQYRDFSTVIGFGQIFPASSPDTIATLKAMFGPTSKSAAALDALLYEPGSRAQQMHQDGLLTTTDYVDPSDYANARNIT